MKTSKQYNRNDIWSIVDHFFCAGQYLMRGEERRGGYLASSLAHNRRWILSLQLPDTLQFHHSERTHN
jgi:hypothetical protein